MGINKSYFVGKRWIAVFSMYSDERLAQWVAVYADGRGEHRPAPMEER